MACAVQGDAARFYVSAHVASLVDQAPSPYAIKRHSRSESSLTQVPSFTEDSEESWQPDTEDSDDPPVQVCGSRMRMLVHIACCIR